MPAARHIVYLGGCGKAFIFIVRRKCEGKTALLSLKELCAEGLKLLWKKGVALLICRIACLLYTSDAADELEV